MTSNSLVCTFGQWPGQQQQVVTCQHPGQPPPVFHHWPPARTPEGFHEIPTRLKWPLGLCLHCRAHTRLPEGLCPSPDLQVSPRTPRFFSVCSSCFLFYSWFSCNFIYLLFLYFSLSYLCLPFVYLSCLYVSVFGSAPSLHEA